MKNGKLSAHGIFLWVFLSVGLTLISAQTRNPAGQKQHKYNNIAIADFEARGLPKSDVDILTDRLRIALVNVGEMRVMERAQMDAILKEQAFQQTGLCSDAECQLRIGQMLGVDFIVVGSIGLLGGEVYSVNIRVIDVATGEVAYSVAEDHSGRMSVLLSRIVPDIARRITEGMRKKMQGPPTTGVIRVSTEPSGLKIRLNGKVHGVSPLLLNDVSPGKYKVEVVDSLYTGSQEVEVIAGREFRVQLNAAATRGSLHVVTQPAGLMLFLNGIAQGKSPLTLRNIGPGSYRIEVMDSLYNGSQEVEVVAGKEVRIQLVTRPTKGNLSIHTVPSGLTIAVNGRPSGKSPLFLRGLIPEKYRIEVQDSVYTGSQEVDIQEGMDSRVQIQVKKNVGILKITTTPPGAKVTLDDRYRGITPLELRDVEMGTHSVTLKLEKAFPYQSLINVRPNVINALDKKMEMGLNLSLEVIPSDARIRIDNVSQNPWPGSLLLKPGKYDLNVEKKWFVPYQQTVNLTKDSHLRVELKKKEWTLKHKMALGLVGLSFASAGSGAFFNFKGNYYHEDYKSAVESRNYEGAVWAHDHVKNADLKRNVSYGVSIGSLAIGLFLLLSAEGE